MCPYLMSFLNITLAFARSFSAESPLVLILLKAQKRVSIEVQCSCYCAKGSQSLLDY